NVNVINGIYYYKYLELLNSADMCLIPLQKVNNHSGLINITISFLLGKICMITKHRKSRYYIKSGYNGFLISSVKDAEKIIKQSLNNPDKFNKIGLNAHETFNKEHRLESLVEKIFSCLKI
ncbi:glycosyltransferase, partial [Candidatus Falkowbacteria bacterium]|nr:glycosyltransferase [Candidatus Falkowbacteria bacterium]